MTDLFSAGKTGNIETRNRIFMAPLTRSRADDDTDVPSDMAVTYYEQRASSGLIIAEATQVNQEGKGYVKTPGIYSQEQVSKWREITDAVHAKGGKIVLQFFNAVH